MKTIREKSADTLIIEARLRDLDVGQAVTYGELSLLIGRDVRDHARGSIRTARRSVLVESKIITECVRGEGVKRISGEDAVGTSGTCLSRMRRIANREADRLAAVEFAELPDDAKRKHLTMSAQLGAIHLMAMGTTTKKIAANVNGVADAIPVGKVLELFK